MIIEHKDNLIEIIYKERAKKEEQQLALADRVLDSVNKIYKENPDKKFSIMLNLIDPDVYFDASSWKAYKKYSDMLGMKQTYRMAVLADNKFADIVTNLAFSHIKDRKANFFTDREKALRWLGVQE